MTSRKFMLYNSKKDLVDFNNMNIVVLNPEGLGVSFSDDLTNAGANFLLNSRKLSAPSLKLNIVFSRNSTDP